ncbi:MAG TPA: lysoplasmalogenase [Candidatus Hydrogenedentes bacterium]|nr:lysoplasmalogenase [Candidatus Hydrogenedentota bacterium]HOV75462.1 lysoplasmalogenase [Candidatus Hydrogenedentota bacterium]HPC17883.1 lysoplasmalogenase [Candidatus Hydrogenedentota bacterium]HRT21258.1 lysoplasmalogenase [Candidatus Hydrogenedentota bacterium]HRT65120.1 lysoplasmalogenase [Candidatus Hydrogenedentota bacterium]
MSMMLPWICLSLAAAFLLLEAEYSDAQPRRAIFKTLASTGFLLTAISAGALESVYGRAVLIALGLSWLGDVLLLSGSERVFQIGLFCFLAAHIAYGGAFLASGIKPFAALAMVGFLLPVVVIIVRWLWPHVPGHMRFPVGLYILVITGMVALSGGMAALSGRLCVFVAAFIFYLSDLAVARDRFVSPGFVNALWGLPLYYMAQLLFAYSASLES